MNRVLTGFARGTAVNFQGVDLGEEKRLLGAVLGWGLKYTTPSQLFATAMF